jgi:hypothetical protein
VGACVASSIFCNLAAYLRENSTALPSNSIIRPFHVSEADDKMCFALFSSEQLPSEIASLLSFKFSVPSSLKVDNSVYDFVDAAPSSTSLADMSVSFLTKAIISSHDSELGDGEVDDIHRATQSLSAYQTKVFETFFWSSSSTRTYFNNHKTTANASYGDAARAYKWNSLSSTFRFNLALDLPDLSSNASVTAADPCNFKAMKIEKHSDRVVMSLTGILALHPDMQSACVAFMTASLAQQPGAWHIALNSA